MPNAETKGYFAVRTNFPVAQSANRAAFETRSFGRCYVTLWLAARRVILVLLSIPLLVASSSRHPRLPR